MSSLRLQGVLLRGSKVPHLCDKAFAELSGELSGAICIKTLVSLGGALEWFRKFFGALRAIFWFWGSFLAAELHLTILSHFVGSFLCFSACASCPAHFFGL